MKTQIGLIDRLEHEDDGGFEDGRVLDRCGIEQPGQAQLKHAQINNNGHAHGREVGTRKKGSPITAPMRLPSRIVLAGTPDFWPRIIRNQMDIATPLTSARRLQSAPGGQAEISLNQAEQEDHPGQHEQINSLGAFAQEPPAE